MTTQYRVVMTGVLDDCVEKVNDLIKESWKQLGGISISISEGDEYLYSHYAQAMTKCYE